MALSEAKRAYHRKYMRERYQNDPEHRRRHRERTDRNDARYRRQTESLIAEFRVGGCQMCPESAAPCLTAHHLDPDSKDFDIGAAISCKYAPSKVAAELAKCVCLCMNCHMKLHAGLVELAGQPLVAKTPSPQLELFRHASA